MSTGEGQPTTADPALASAAVAAAGDAIVTTDGHGWITSWNRAAELLLGVSAEQAIGQTLALIGHTSRSSPPLSARWVTAWRWPAPGIGQAARDRGSPAGR